MATTPYPLPRETRESTILVGNGTPGPYGPTNFEVFDVLDVEVWRKLAVEEWFSKVAATVTKTTSEPFSPVTVLFAENVAASTEFIITARRTHERSLAVTKAGTMDSDQLEKELSKQGTVISELRRDVDRGGAVRAGVDGQTLVFGPDGRVRPGADQSEIENAQTYAEIAQGVDAGRALIYPANPAPEVYDAHGRTIGNVGDAATLDGAATFRQVQAVRPTLKAAKSLAYNMHFRALRGRGWMTGEAGGNVDYVLNAAAVAGAKQLVLTPASAKPITAQLIAYRGIDGEYYSAVVGSVAGNNVNLSAPIEIGIDAGANAHNFYINESHPNFWGYQAICDDMLRSSLGRWRQVHQEAPIALGGSALIAFTTDNAANPGSSAGGGWQVTSVGANTGCQYTLFRPQRTGRYRAIIKCNRGGGDGNQLVEFKILVNGGYHYTKVIDTADLAPTYIDFSVMDGDAVEFRVLKDQTVAFFVSDLVVLEYHGEGFDGFEAGRHFVFGDSWAAISTDIGQGIGIIDRLRARFPLATFINKGVGGNTAAMMVARFDADVAADVAVNGPVKSMLIIDGTNDYFSAVSPTDVGRSIGILIAKSLALGITPITFTSSVGSYTESATRFALSRRYALEIAITEKAMGHWQRFTPRLDGTTIVGAGTYTQQLGLWRRTNNRVDFVINLQWSAHTGTGNMKLTQMPLPASLAAYPCSIVFSNLAYTSHPVAYVAAAGEIFLGEAASGGPISALPIDAAGLLYVSGSYWV